MGRTKRVNAPGPAQITNHYAVMGIHDFAPGSDARRAYRLLALRWHPDRQIHATEDCRKDAEDKFKRINEAYTVLSDDPQRREFDESLRRELLGILGRTTHGTTNNARPAATRTKVAKRGGRPSESGVRLVMCPKCGTGAGAKDDEKGGPSIQCRQCAVFFHEVYCAGCKDWGATEGRRGESTMRCGCGNMFCQSRCPSCSQWNTFNGGVQGARTRYCGFCSRSFHEAFCPGCSSWGVWEGSKGYRSLSCDCGGLFCEISCQSCGMWGSVKGRHADNKNNTLRCGTCGCESHEAFCPACGRWDYFPGSKGESTLECRKSKCRGESGIRKAGVKFFQVYCESCARWRSVRGAKDAVGGASVCCAGCESAIDGTTCPACGNWDKHNQQPQQQQQQQTPRISGDGISLDAGALDRDHYIPKCSSCGHQPPPDGKERGQLRPRDNFAASGVVNASLHGESANAASEDDGDVVVGAIKEASSRTAFQAVGDAEARTSEGVQPPVKTNVSETKSSARRSKSERNSEPLRADDGRAIAFAAVALGTSDGENYDDEVTDGVDPPHISWQDGQKPNHGVVAGTTTDTKTTASAPAIALEEDVVEILGGGVTAADTDGDYNAIPSAETSGGKFQPTPRAPLPSSDSRRRLRRRSSGHHYAPRPIVTEASDADAASTKAGARATQEDFHERFSYRGIANGAASISSESSTIDETRNLKNVTDGARNNGGDSCTRSSETWGKFESASTVGSCEAVDPPERGPLLRSSHPGRRLSSWGKTKNGSTSRRGRCRSRSSFPHASAGVDAVSAGDCCHQGDSTTTVDHSNGANDETPAAIGVTLAAVSREDSPPPPPGVRVGETVNAYDGKGRENNSAGYSDPTEKRGQEGDFNRSHGGGGETFHGSRARGRPGVFHLAFCSKCQEYRGWRASFLERRVTGKTRKNCPDCGDALSDVSYYPKK